MVLASLDRAYDDEDDVAQPVRTALGAAGPRTEHMLPGLTKVGAPIPVSLPTLKPPKSPSPNERPSVYPGGRVIWREARPPTLDEARAGRRADLSNLFDVASLHQEELRRVSQLMARQPLSTPMHAPPKVAPPISPNVLGLAGLDLPYDHQQQQAALAVRTSPAQSPVRPRTQAQRGGDSDHGYLAAAQTNAVLAAAETIHGGAGGGLRPYMPKPSSRADVVQLQALLERRLHESNGLLGEQIRAWDEAFVEVVRQVGLHCTERGALLDEIRSRYTDVRPPDERPPGRRPTPWSPRFPIRSKPPILLPPKPLDPRSCHMPHRLSPLPPCHMPHRLPPPSLRAPLPPWSVLFAVGIAPDPRDL